MTSLAKIIGVCALASERHDGSGMGDHCAVAAAGPVGRTATHGRCARGRRCHSVHRVQWVPVADAPQGFSAEVHGAGLLLRDTVGEITIRRQKPLVLRIMVEQVRTMILFLSE